MGAYDKSARLTPARNHLLAALPREDFARLEPHLELVPLPLGWAVYESGGRQGYVYFPTTAIVSLLYVMADGDSAEIAVVGNDGLVGIALFMGGETTPSRAVVQSEGLGYRLKGLLLKGEFERGGELQHLLLRYTQALITQMAQTAVAPRGRHPGRGQAAGGRGDPLQPRQDHRAGPSEAGSAGLRVLRGSATGNRPAVSRGDFLTLQQGAVDVG